MSLTRYNFATENEWLAYAAENGVSDLQIALASWMLNSRTDDHRAVDAYKWLFIATFLGNYRAKELAHFVRMGMTEEQVAEAEAKVELWLEEKTEQLLEMKTADWSRELRKQFKSGSVDLLRH